MIVPLYFPFQWTVIKLNENLLYLTAKGNIVPTPEGCAIDELMDFLQNAPIAMHWLSGNGTILWANNTELKTLGYSESEYIGHSITEVIIYYFLIVIYFLSVVIDSFCIMRQKL